MIYHSASRRRTIEHRLSGGRHRITRRFGIMVALMLIPTGALAAAVGFIGKILF